MGTVPFSEAVLKQNLEGRVTRVDGHLHVWRAAAGQTPNVATLVPPQTDVPIEAARVVLDQHKIARAVLVQPVFRGEDNSYVADCARAEPDRYAAVCVVDPRTPGADERLARWVEHGCRGLRLRPRLAAEEAIFGDPATYPLWEAAGRLGVVVSLLCGPSHLATVDELAGRFADVAIVIDHLGHPNPAAGPHDPAFRRCSIWRVIHGCTSRPAASTTFRRSRTPLPTART